MTSEPLWDFALALYSQPDVAALCLQLQDEHLVNVNLLLFARWLETRQRPLDVSAALACVGDWDRDYVQVLRQLRRRMKQAFATRLAEVAEVREQIKRAELLAERQQLAWLEQLAGSWSPDDSLVAGENIRLYLNQLQVPKASTEAAVAGLTGGLG